MATKTRPAPVRLRVGSIVPSHYVPGRTSQVTVADFIVEQINAGVDPINAAAVVGVDAGEFRAWMREGMLVFAKLNAGADWTKAFTPEQQDAALFAQETIRAHAAHISRLTVVSEQIARGQLPPKVKTVRKSVNGQPTEETVTTETMLPDADMVRWKLEKLAPDIYGQKATLNITVSDLTDTAATVDIVEQRMREVAEALMASLPGAIETTATESAESSPESGVETAPAPTVRAKGQVKP